MNISFSETLSHTCHSWDVGIYFFSVHSWGR